MVLHVVVTGSCSILSSIFNLRKWYIWRNESDVKTEIDNLEFSLNLNGNFKRKVMWLAD